MPITKQVARAFILPIFNLPVNTLTPTIMFSPLKKQNTMPLLSIPLQSFEGTPMTYRHNFKTPDRKTIMVMTYYMGKRRNATLYFFVSDCTSELTCSIIGAGFPSISNSRGFRHPTIRKLYWLGLSREVTILV